MIEYELFFNYSLDMFVIAGLDGYFRRVNPAFCNMLGFSEDELLSRPFANWIHPDDLGKVEGAIKNLSSGHPAFLVEVRLLCADGTYRLLQWTAYPDLKSGLLFAIARDYNLTYYDSQQLKLLMDSSPTAVFIVEQSGIITYSNQLAEEIFGYEKNEMIRKQIETLIPVKFRKTHVKHREKYVSSPTMRPMGILPNLVGQRKNGDEFPIEVGLNPVYIDQGTIIICSVIDVSSKRDYLNRLMQDRQKLEKANSRLGHLADHDTLTGLYNRRGLERVCLGMLAAVREKKGIISIILTDIDYFKDYNDAFGHSAGDQMLKHLATILSENIRKEDTVARIGGEEFIIVLPGIEHSQAAQFGERLRHSVEHSNLSPRPATISLGATTYRFRSKRVALKLIMEQIISEADQAMYHSKNAGRNIYSHFLDFPNKH